jgi:GNAT superfamily N-acetyltransferase
LITATFSIRRAEGVERRAISRQLFPHSAQENADIFVAAEADNPKPIGAAAIWFTPSRHFPEHGDFVVHVVEAHRRNGVGGALLQSLTAAAHDLGAKQLRSPILEQNSIGFGFAMACGFTANPATIIYEAPIENFGRITGPLCQQMRKRGRLPGEAQIVPLTDAPKEEVCRLVTDQLGASLQHVAERLRKTEHGYSQTLSRVALVGDKVVGAVLMTYQKAVAWVDAIVVLPNHRNGWANAALKQAVFEDLAARGVKSVRFSANSGTHRDTANLARRTKAQALKTTCVATMDLNLQ